MICAGLLQATRGLLCLQLVEAHHSIQKPLRDSRALTRRLWNIVYENTVDMPTCISLGSVELRRKLSIFLQLAMLHACTQGRLELRCILVCHKRATKAKSTVNSDCGAYLRIRIALSRVLYSDIAEYNFTIPCRALLGGLFARKHSLSTVRLLEVCRVFRVSSRKQMHLLTW